MADSEYQQRYCAFVDILGFSELIGGEYTVGERDGTSMMFVTF